MPNWIVAKLDNQSYIPGKQLLPRLAVGCLVFAAGMGFGTYFLAQMMTPYLRHKNEEYLRTHRPPDSPPLPARAAGGTTP